MQALRHRSCAVVVTVISLLIPAGLAPAAITVHFDKDLYIVNGPGESFQAQILIDGLAATEGDDPVRGGLFSSAVAMSFNSAKAKLDGPSDILVPAELDFFGFPAGPAYRDVSAGFAGVKGNIDQNDNPLVPYTAPLLASLKVTNLASAPDNYPLELDFFRTLGPNEQFFLNGLGDVLDPNIQFRPARVLIVPEPTSAVLALVSLLLLSSVCRRRSCTAQ